MATWTGAAGTSDWYFIKHTHFGFPDDTLVSNWDVTPNTPANGDSISIGSVYTVTNGSGTYGSLTLGTGASLTIASFFSVTSVSNGGSIVVTPAGSAGYFVFRSNAATLTGGGTITLASDDVAHRGSALGFDDGFNLVLTNTDNTIAGGGSISGNRTGSLTLINNGTINATGNSTNVYGALTIDATGGVTNNNLIEATGTAGLTTGSTIDNRNGQMKALDGSHLTLSGVITGGTITALGSGYITAAGATFDGSNAGGISLSGTVNATGATLKGAVSNASVINVGTFNYLYIDAAGATLSGGGTITLNADAGQHYPSVIYGSQAGPTTLTNVDNTISGGGSIADSYSGPNQLTFINNGTISATGNANNNLGGLTIGNTGGFTNGGTIKAAVQGSILNITTGRSVTNNGVLLASNGGTLNVSDAVSGTGTAQLSAGGIVSFASTFNQNVIFSGASAGTLQLSQSYGGTVMGFVAGDRIDLTNIGYSAAYTKVFTRNGGTGTLAIMNGAATVASLAFTGSYNASAFVLGDDGAGHELISTTGPVTTRSVLHDVNADGTSDVLLQSGSTVVDWILKNGNYQSGTVLANSSGFAVVGAGDFNADGTADVLLQSGSTVVDWILQNGAYQSGNVLANSSGYKVVGTGDFNADGTSDVLLQSGSSVVDWILKNGAYQSGNVLANSSGYNVVGTGDVNGDGTADVLLQLGNSVVDWIIKDGAYQSGNVLANSSGYSVVGTGDFNGDGTTDVLLQNGNSVIDWILGNGAYQSGNVIANSSGYQVVGTGDYNGDGTTDILLQNGSSVVQWTMQNGAYQSGAVLANSSGFAVKV